MTLQEWVIVVLIVVGALAALSSIIEQAVYRAILRYQALRYGALGGPEDAAGVASKIRGEAIDRK